LFVQYRGKPKQPSIIQPLLFWKLVNFEIRRALLARPRTRASCDFTSILKVELLTGDPTPRQPQTGASGDLAKFTPSLLAGPGGSAGKLRNGAFCAPLMWAKAFSEAGMAPLPGKGQFPISFARTVKSRRFA
jgi:hypothetical protein